MNPDLEAIINQLMHLEFAKREDLRQLGYDAARMLLALRRDHGLSHSVPRDD